ncbi:MAG TPA: hypothetical protein VLK85_05170 [Ramlibacter sp.]|nr:hypothetical protein [Ramlibacter sp.]
MLFLEFASCKLRKAPTAMRLADKRVGMAVSGLSQGYGDLFRELVA